MSSTSGGIGKKEVQAIYLQIVIRSSYLYWYNRAIPVHARKTKWVAAFGGRNAEHIYFQQSEIETEIVKTLYGIIKTFYRVLQLKVFLLLLAQLFLQL